MVHPKMLCPICRKTVNPKSAEAPFCSERCRVIDLGAWASGDYVLSTEPLNQEDGE